MIGFLIRKTLYDLWDNMFKIVVLNLGFIAVCAIPIFIPAAVEGLTNSIAAGIAAAAIGILGCSVYLAAAAYTIKVISDYKTFSFKDFILNFKYSWRAGLVMGVFIFCLYIIVTIIIPFYLGIESLFGLLLAAIIFWLTFFVVLAMQFYFTIYARLGFKIFKTLKKSMIISLDNSGFSFFMFLHNIVVMIISVILVFMFPGPVGILLYLDEAFRLRLLKYDWLEANPEENRKKIPWDVLLIDEREKTGTRSFRNFIFPWKD